MTSIQLLARTYPNKKETMVLLRAWEKHLSDAEERIRAIQTALGVDIEGPLASTIHGLADAYTQALAMLVGADDWLDWYANENAMGRKGLKASATFEGPLSSIQNLQVLYKLIEQERKIKK